MLGCRICRLAFVLLLVPVICTSCSGPTRRPALTRPRSKTHLADGRQRPPVSTIPGKTNPDAKQPASLAGKPSSCPPNPKAGTSAKKPLNFGSELPADAPLLTKWHREVPSAWVSPNRAVVALYDRKAVYLTDLRGRRIRRIPVTLYEDLANEIVSVYFAFRPDSRRVAVFTSLDYGEPIGAKVDRLWTVDTVTGKRRRLQEWEYRIQGPGPQVGDYELAGWTADGRAVVLNATVYDGEEMPIDQQAVGSQRIVVQDRWKTEVP